MRLQFWQKPAPRKLSINVKQTLIAQFPQDSQAVEQMRLLGKMGRFAGRRAEFIRIYDPSLIKGGGAATLRYEELLEAQGNRGALLFEGHIEKIDNNERVFLADRRAA